MSDYLPPLVMELQGRDTSMLKALGRVSEGVERFAGIVERMGGITTEAAAANSRYARSFSTVARSSTRAATAIAAVRDASGSTTRSTTELGAATGRASASTERLGTQAARTSGLMGVLGAETQRTAERMGAFSGRTARLGGAFARASGDMDGFKGKLKSAGVGVAAVGVGIAAVSVKMAADFQSSMIRLKTSAGETGDIVGGRLTGELAHVADGVKKMAVDTATPLSELSAALYRIESAGFHGGDGLKILRAAAEGARSEGANLDTVANTLDSTMNAFGFHIGDVNGVMNAMVETVAHGKASMQELAGSLSTVTPVASAAGLHLEQMLGAMATMTAQGVTAKQASQNLAFAIRNLQAPSNVARQAMASIGLNATDLSKNLGKRGLTGTFDLITQAVAKSSKGGMVLVQTMNTSKAAAQSAQTELAHMSGETKRLAQGYLDGKISLGAYKEAVKGLPSDQANLALQFKATADQANGFNQMLKNGSGPQKTAAELLKRLMGGANGLNTYLELSGIHAGTFADNVNGIGKAVRDNSKHVHGFADVQKTFNFQMEQAKQVVETAAVSIGSKLLPILSSVMGFLKRHQTTAKVLAVGIGLIATTLGLAAAAMIAFEVATSPITAIVGLIMLILAGFYELYKHSELVRIAVADFIGTMKAGFGAVAVVVLTVAKTIVDVWLTGFGLMVKAAAKAFGWVPGIGGQLKRAAAGFDGFKSSVDKTFDGLIGKAMSFTQAQVVATKERELKIRIQGWTDNINTAKKQLNSLPPDKQVPLKADISRWQKSIAKAQSQLDAMHGRTVTLTIAQQYTVKGTPATTWHAPMAPKANGGITKAANGLMSRQAMFASRPILWAEAGPEAYIPLSPSKRRRSRSLAEQTVGILGGSVAWGGPFSMSAAVAAAGPGTYAGGVRGGQRGGDTYIFNVRGSVVTERELAGLVEQEMLRKGARRGVTYQPYSR